MSLAGVYYRVEDNDTTKFFRNRMRISLEGSRAVFQTTWKGPIDLKIQWSDDSTFEVDWAPVCSRWGRGVFRLYDHHGVRGLLEDGEKFWKYMPDGAGHVEDSRDPDTSRSLRRLRSSPADAGERRHETATVEVGSPQGYLEWMRSTYRGMPLLHARPGNIQKVMYINLAKRTDRRRLILGELESLEIAPESIIRIEAVDAAHCSESPLECCARSHIAALEHAILQDLDAVLILEDDFQLSHSPRHTRERWVHFLQTVLHFDIVSWAHNCLRPWSRAGTGDVRVWYLQTASAYVVRRPAMHRLRDIYVDALVQHRPFDRHMTNIREEVQWYALRPALSLQRPSFSDILGKWANSRC